VEPIRLSMKAGRFGLGRLEPGMQIQDRSVAGINVGEGHIRPGDLTGPSSSFKAGGVKIKPSLTREVGCPMFLF
jgi:hypothetical protein